MKPNELTLNTLTLGAKLLAQVSTPPAALLAPDPEAPTPTRHLTLYGLADGGYTVVSTMQADGMPADTRVQKFSDAAELQTALGTRPLPSALYHLAAVPAPCTRDSGGNLSISAATIHCVAWAEMTNWWDVVGTDHFPTTFADTGALRRHIEQRAAQVSVHKKQKSLELWQGMTETVAMRAVQDLQAGARPGKPI